MIRSGPTGSGVVPKDETPSGRRYVARKKRDQIRAKVNAQWTGPDWFRVTDPGLRDTELGEAAAKRDTLPASRRKRRQQ